MSVVFACSLLAYFPSLTVDISDLTVRKRHTGQYLLCRIATPPVRTVGATMAIVSPSGCATQLSVYHFPILPASLWPPAQSDVDAAFPLHQVLAIKEPLLKMAATGNTPLVRVDSPSDLMFVPLNHALLESVSWKALCPQNGSWIPPRHRVKSVEEWKLAGNKVRTLNNWG